MKRKKKKNRPAPTLSLCMIVKDEEHFIGHCLESVKTYVDEMVVVDTGSSDGTKEIALSHGARVYEHPWEGDFSKHKNQAIDYAAGDWILIMDADEALKPGSGEALRKAITQNKEAAVLVTIISYFNNKTSQTWESKVRLFQKKSGIHYEGMIHEQLVGYQSVGMHPIYLLHYGYNLDNAALEKKFERTLNLLTKQIEKEPDQYWLRHNLAVTYAAHFKFNEAIKSAKKALALARDHESDDHNLLWTYYVLSSSAFKLNDLKSSEKYALEAIHRSADHLDSYFILTLVYHANQRWDELEVAAQNYISTRKRINRSPEQYRYMMIHSTNELWRIRLALANVYLDRGNDTSAETEFQSAISLTPIKSQCYRLISNIYRENGNLDLAESYCQKAWDTGDRGVEYLMSRAKIQEKKGDEKGYDASIEKIRQITTDQTDILAEVGKADLIAGRCLQAIAIFEKIIDTTGPDHDALINLGLAYKYTDRQDDAIRCNKQALELQPDSLHALTNLGHLFYETGEFTSAADHYERALKLDDSLVDILLRLAFLNLHQGNADECVRLCDQILKTLDLPRNMTLDSLEDLALVFLLIATTLEKHGKIQLAKQAIQIALKLNPDCINNYEINSKKVGTAYNLGSSLS